MYWCHIRERHWELNYYLSVLEACCCCLCTCYCSVITCKVFHMTLIKTCWFSTKGLIYMLFYKCSPLPFCSYGKAGIIYSYFDSTTVTSCFHIHCNCCQYMHLLEYVNWYTANNLAGMWCFYFITILKKAYFLHIVY